MVSPPLPTRRVGSKVPYPRLLLPTRWARGPHFSLVWERSLTPERQDSFEFPYYHNPAHDNPNKLASLRGRTV